MTNRLTNNDNEEASAGDVSDFASDDSFYQHNFEEEDDTNRNDLGGFSSITTRKTKTKNLASSFYNIEERQPNPVLIEGRESHTSDMEAFAKFITRLKEEERHSLDSHFNSQFWDYIGNLLKVHGKPLGGCFAAAGGGCTSSTIQTKSRTLHPDTYMDFLCKKMALDSIAPINPTIVAEAAGVTLDVALTELLYASHIGLTSIKFAPECARCGGAVCTSEWLSYYRDSSQPLKCQACTYENLVTQLDQICIVFVLHPSVFYVLAQGFGCFPSAESQAATVLFACVPAMTDGTSFRCSVGCGSTPLMPDPLPKGMYRMQCLVSGSENYLEVLDDAPPLHNSSTSDGDNTNNNNDMDDDVVVLPIRVSELARSTNATQEVEQQQQQQQQQQQADAATLTTTGILQEESNREHSRPVLQVPHGRIHFDIYPDTCTVYGFWIQHNIDDDTAYFKPHVERAPYTSVARIMHHPAFDRYFSPESTHDILRVATSLELQKVTIVFTDIVGSNDMYEALGDMETLEILKKQYRILYHVFSGWGRVVKCFGDSVMGAFAGGPPAIKAAAKAMKQITKKCQRSDGMPIHIKISIHAGPAMVVPLNNINDYFGSTVNQTRRMQKAKTTTTTIPYSTSSSTGEFSSSECGATVEQRSSSHSECWISESLLEDESESMDMYHKVCALDDFQAIPTKEFAISSTQGYFTGKGIRLIEEECCL